MKQKILVVEDEKEMLSVLNSILTKHGFTVMLAEDANEAYEKIKYTQPDLILLDLVLPDISGFKFCEFIKKDSKTMNIPIIMLTSMDKITDKVSGLDLGADDYITKPFDHNELIARIHATLRKIMRKETPKGIIESGTLALDPQAHTVHIGKESIDLGPKEFDLLFRLMKGKGRVFTRNELLNDIWGYEYSGTSRTVDVHIRYLRRKLKNHSKKIETVEGIGYRFSYE